MSHKCEIALITCEDFRLQQRKDGRNYVAEFIKSLGEDCDLITRGGGVQDLVRPPHQGFFWKFLRWVGLDFKKSLLRDVEVSVKLHQASTIHLVNHEDCGAYGGMNFSSRDEELAQHKKDLGDAKKIILEKFPEINIKLYFAELKGGTEDIFIIKEIR